MELKVSATSFYFKGNQAREILSLLIEHYNSNFINFIPNSRCEERKTNITQIAELVLRSKKKEVYEDNKEENNLANRKWQKS